MRTTPGMTSGQKRDLRNLLKAALDNSELDRELAQEVLSRGGALKTQVRQLLNRLSHPLKRVNVVEIPKIGGFRASDHFIKDKPDEVLMHWIGENVKKNFFANEDEEESEATELRFHRIQAHITEKEIITKLGGENAVVTNIAQVFETMKILGNPDYDLMLYFFARNFEGVLWVINCFWHSSYNHWRVGANASKDEERYDSGIIVTRSAVPQTIDAGPETEESTK